MRRWAVVGAMVALASAAGWLWVENRRLRGELAMARSSPDGAAARAGQGGAEGHGDGAGAGRARGGRRGTDPLAVMRRFGQALDGAEPEAPRPPEDFEARRERRQRRVRDLLGRREGEGDEAYRERVAPLVTAALAVPRERMEERRREAEEAAGVTPEQRARMDQALADAQAELLAHANRSIASGDLTPYQRNSRGVLAFVGGAVPIADGLDQRMRGIFTAEQLAAMEEAGFDWLEYLGVSAPWETLDPPPPAPSGPGKPGG